MTAIYGVQEPIPGGQWRALFDATWAGYRAWYLREGDSARPDLRTSRRMLGRHLPELVPTWERLVELAAGDETAARMLTLYHPPPFVAGCSQAVLAGDAPVLVRNYDYHPDLWERVVYSSAFTGRRVIGSSDCLWGLLDGMNDAGLVVSLAFGGQRVTGPGFGIPLVVRYLLETAETVPDVTSTLARVPVNMAYNLSVLDRRGEAVTVFVAPDAQPQVFVLPAATNHRGTEPDWPEHARTYRSVERQRLLLDLLSRHPDPDSLVAAFLRPPLYNTAYAEGFGTLYTAAYRPTIGAVDYIWPRSTWRRGFDSPSAAHTFECGLDQPGAVADPDPMRSRDELAAASPDELAELAELAIQALAHRDDPAAFTHLLRLTSVVGECVGTAARTLAGERSWSGVAQIAGTSKQAAWERWRQR